MGTRTKGGMYCPRCQRPVAAERTGHAVRNSLGAVLSAGLSIKTERWHCPTCGGPVESERFRKIHVPPPPAEQPEGTLTVTLMHPGSKAIPALREYRRLTGASLKAARTAFEQVPTVVGHFTPTEAKRVHAGLMAVGCAVEVSEPSNSPPADGQQHSVADELRTLAQLHEAGSLSDDEFAVAKARLLGQ